MNLYQIEQQYLTLASQLEQGELTQEMEQLLEMNANDLKNKAVNYGFVIKQLDGDCDIIDAEIKRLQEMKKAKANAVTRLKDAVSQAMQMYGLEKIETPIMKLNFRRSESVEIVNAGQIPLQFLREKTTVTEDKVAIKEAIKSGESVSGAVLVTNLNLQIK